MSSENASQVSLLATLGKGAILKTYWAAVGEVLVVQTPFGLHFLESSSFQEVSFLAGVVEFYPLIGGEKILLRYPAGSLSVVQANDGEELFTMSYQVKIPWYVQDWLDKLSQDEAEKRQAEYLGELNQVRALAISADQQSLAVAFGDDHIRIWDLDDGKLLHDLQHDEVAEINQMVFSPDGQRLAFVEASRDMGVWQTDVDKLLWHRKEVGHINGQPFSHDGSLLAVEVKSYFSEDSWVVLLRAEYGDELGRVVGRVASDPFSADGKYLATTWYQRVRIYRTSNLEFLAKLETGLDWPTASYTVDGVHILVNGGEQAWSSQDFNKVDSTAFMPTPQPEYEDPSVRLRDLGYYNGLQSVLPMADGKLRLWGRTNRTEYYWLDLPGGEVNPLNIPTSPDTDLEDFRRAVPIIAADSSALFYCTGGRLFILPVADPQARDLGRCSGSAVLTYSPTTGLLARGLGTTLDLLDGETGEILHNLLGHYKQISGLEFSPDGSLLASGSQDTAGRGYGEVGLWVTEPASNLLLDSRQPYGVYELAYSPDNQWLAFSNNGQIKLWSVVEERLYAFFDSTAIRFTFSPDSQVLAAGDREGNVTLHAIPGGEEIARLDAGEVLVSGMLFSPDGATLTVVSNDGLVRFFGIP